MSDTTEVQTRQADYWNGEGAARWLASRARRADPSRSAFVERCFEKADIQPGERVIEIGCGTGEVAARIAERVGPTGSVLAVDVSQPILAQADGKVAGFAHAATLLADASTHPFEPGSADLLFSTFGVMFFADPAGAFANMRKALKPGGRMVFVCWRAQMTAAREAVLAVLPRLTPDPREPGPLAFADQAYLAEVLAAGGFTSVEIEGLDAMRDLSNGNGVDGAVEGAMAMGPIARLATGEPQAVKDTIAAELGRYFASIAVDGAVMQPSAVWVVTAA